MKLGDYRACSTFGKWGIISTLHLKKGKKEKRKRGKIEAGSLHCASADPTRGKYFLTHHNAALK